MGKKIPLAAALAAGLMLSACGKSSSTSTAKTTLNLMESDTIATFDQSASTTVPIWDVLEQLDDGLFRSDKNNKPVPALAKKTVKSNGGKRYTFYLRSAKWSNGDEVTAQDFVTAWKRGVAPTSLSGYSYIYQGIKNATAIQNGKKKASTLGVKAVGKHKLVVNLEYPIPTFTEKLTMISFMPQDTKLVKKYGKKYGTSMKTFATNGAFKLGSWKAGANTWTLVKNPNYYAKSEVKLSKIKYQVVKEANTAHQLFQQGSLDDAMITGTTAQGLKNDKHLKYVNRSGNYFIRTNQAKGKVLSNAKLRQALYLVINRKQLAEKVMANGSKPSYTYSSPGAAKYPGTNKDFATVAKPKEIYNVAKAKKLWKEGLKELGKSSVTLTLVGYDTSTDKNQAEFLQSQIESKLPNVKIEVKSLPFTSAYTLAVKGEFDLQLSYWMNDYADPMSELETQELTNSHNFGKYTSKNFNKQLSLAKSKNAVSKKAYFKNLLNAQNQLSKDNPVIPLCTEVEDHLVNSKLRGALWHTTGVTDYTRAYFVK